MSFCSKLHGQLEVHRHPEGRRQPAHRLVWSAHSHDHHSGLLCPRLPERPERDVCRKVGGVVRLPPLTQPKPEPVRTDNLPCLTLTWTAAAHWQTSRAHTDQMLHSCKELGSQHTGYRHQAWWAGCVVVGCFLFLFCFFNVSDNLLICTDECHKSGFHFALSVLGLNLILV